MQVILYPRMFESRQGRREIVNVKEREGYEEIISSPGNWLWQPILQH